MRKFFVSNYHPERRRNYSIKKILININTGEKTGLRIIRINV